MVDEDSDHEEHDVNYEMKDYTQHIFDLEPNLEGEFTPHERSKNLLVDTSPLFSPSHGRDIIQEEYGLQVIEDFVVQILYSEKVQQNRNTVEGDKRVSEIQDSAFAASWPLISLRHKIVTSDEDLEAEEVLDSPQQSLMCIGSTFKGLSVHRHKVNVFGLV